MKIYKSRNVIKTGEMCEVKSERKEGGRNGIRVGEVYVDAICLPCYLSPRQVQIWSLSFPASLHIHSPSQTLTYKHTHFH